MDLSCQNDARRNAVRRQRGRNGIDYVEVDSDDHRVLLVYFLGELPPELAVNEPGIERHLKLEGGERIAHLRILDADPQPASDPEHDSVLAVRLDRTGDLSTYTLRLVDVAGIDPRYEAATFSFGLCCPSDLDCAPQRACPPEEVDRPLINYLAKDYGGFRQLILDRLAVLTPAWTERHVPDLGITLVELLAYVADQLSYYQDAVATEAYLGTARQRISIRRHARLVDYALHEGCNARAWLHLRVSEDLALRAEQLAFITGEPTRSSSTPNVLSMAALNTLAPGSYELFEPLVSPPDQTLQLREAHNEIRFYTWGRRECCLLAGATRATLLDRWLEREGSATPARALDIRAGDVLIFEEVRGARTGRDVDADPKRRWAIRVTSVKLDEDPVFLSAVGSGEGTLSLPTPVVEISWSHDDALPFALCLSAVGGAPSCSYIEDVSVARGNVILIDHGSTLSPEALPPVPPSSERACCECEGQPHETAVRAGRYRPALARAPLVFSEQAPAPSVPAAQCLAQAPRLALPAIEIQDELGARFSARADLIASSPDDRHFVVENDNAGVSHLRFGDGELGRAPAVNRTLTARYRVGGGAAGNVGPEAITRLVLKQLALGGATVAVRNPLAARGGTDRESMEEARMFAPAAFRRQRERAIIAADYAELAERAPGVAHSSARLAWTGSWYEAEVAIDPKGSAQVDGALLDAVAGQLHRYRRIGHDLHVQAARYVPLRLAIEVCVLPGYDRGHVKAALLERFSNRVMSTGARGLFHPDELSFGESIYLSRIVAVAQAVRGVECATVTTLERRFAAPNHEIEDGVVPLATYEIAQLDNDPNHPERGQLDIVVHGGR